MSDWRGISSFKDHRLQWLHAPASWGVEDPTGNSEGSRGNFEISEDGSELHISPPAFKDFWARTYYSPLLIKSDASGYLCEIPSNAEATVKVDFEFAPKNQFDQAGILVYLDDSHWMKCGIEFCDGSPRLSVVVCNVFSDWSTQPWPNTSARLRIHKILQSSGVVVEAAEIGSDDFHFVRIAHISAMATHNGDMLNDVERRGSSSEKNWRVGPFSAVPLQQRGCVATFRGFSVGDREESVHGSDASEMVVN